MKLLLCFAALAAVYCSVESKFNPPKVQVYSEKPGKYGDDNMLICHVSDFHPPDISIQLLKNGQVIPNAEQTDLAFNGNWHFHLTQNVAFKPQEGEMYLCRITHNSKMTDFAWESNM
ncbi:beta-2 microglobulin [Solea senegalensis]|uniref:Beta-2-microglobulin n=1 Tax=Solea senegalensis TaxID=28829 RepID=A0AAV6QXT4_SOLSE|nr:beta-2-microglobulin-like [Solea senegalensis]KAG7497673.1 beta-2 microglobulin [Solea senegalensis]